MPIHINLYNETELDRARGRAYHLRAYAAGLLEVAENMEQRAAELGADELTDLAGTLRDLAWCLGCDHREDGDLALLIGAHGAATSMIDLAKRAVCRQCQHRGAYVAPVWGLPKKHTGYRDNLERVRRDLLAALEYVAKRLD